MILAWASPFKLILGFYNMTNGLTFEILNI